MKKLQTLTAFFIALWTVCPAWIKTIIVLLIIYVMGDNGIFEPI